MMLSVYLYLSIYLSIDLFSPYPILSCVLENQLQNERANFEILKRNGLQPSKFSGEIEARQGKFTANFSLSFSLSLSIYLSISLYFPSYQI